MSDFNRKDLSGKPMSQFTQVEANLQSVAHTQNKTIVTKVAQTEAGASSNNLGYYDDEKDEPSGFFAKLKLILPIVLIVIICLAIYSWYTDKFIVNKDSTGQLLVIKASNEALREKPEDPGGMKIANQDKKIYDTISGKEDDNEAKSETLLPEAEKPISQEEIIKDLKSSGDVAKNVATNKEATSNNSVSNDSVTTQPQAQINNNVKSSEQIEPNKPTTDKIAAENNDNKPQETKQIVADKTTHENSLEKPELAKKTKKIADITTSNVVDNPQKNKTPQIINKPAAKLQGYRVQIGSFRSSGDAEVSWNSIKKKFSGILLNLNYYIEKADLGEKGVYYRLQLSGIKDEEEARKICQKLTEKKQGCLFVGK